MLPLELRRPGRAGAGPGEGGGAAAGGGSALVATGSGTALRALRAHPVTHSTRADRARARGAHTGSTATHTPRVRDETLESHRGGNVYKYFFLVFTHAGG